MFISKDEITYYSTPFVDGESLSPIDLSQQFETYNVEKIVKEDWRFDESVKGGPYFE